MPKEETVCGPQSLNYLRSGPLGESSLIPGTHCSLKKFQKAARGEMTHNVLLQGKCLYPENRKTNERS